MSYRGRAIILKRKPAADESIYIETLVEDGTLQAFKIPGILKSAKRSSFHFAPGAIYEFEWNPGAAGRTIPKNSQLLFSPYEEAQQYYRLTAVAEILQTAAFIRPGPENSRFFILVQNALESLPAAAEHIDFALDRFYWKFLEYSGLAAESEGGDDVVAYDLLSGFLSARELASRPASDFMLPYAWVLRALGDANADCNSIACREIIRKYLEQI